MINVSFQCDFTTVHLKFKLMGFLIDPGAATIHHLRISQSSWLFPRKVMVVQPNHRLID